MPGSQTFTAAETPITLLDVVRQLLGGGRPHALVRGLGQRLDEDRHGVHCGRGGVSSILEMRCGARGT